MGQIYVMDKYKHDIFSNLFIWAYGCIWIYSIYFRGVFALHLEEYSRKFYINHRWDRNFKLGPIYHYKFTNFILLMNFNGELSDHLFGRIPRYVDFNIFFKYKYIPFNIAISIPGRFSFFYYICLKVSLLRS